MAKGRGHNRKKETRRSRGAKRAGGLPAPTVAQPPQAAAAPRHGLEATRGPVSNAYRAWAADYGRRQAAGVAAQFDGGPVPADLVLLAPLTTRTVEAPGGEVVSVQMGLPLVAASTTVLALRCPTARSRVADSTYAPAASGRKRIACAIRRSVISRTLCSRAVPVSTCFFLERPPIMLL